MLRIRAIVRRIDFKRKLTIITNNIKLLMTCKEMCKEMDEDVKNVRT